MMQLALTFDTPLARSTDPSTSHGAADQAKALQAQHQRVIVACLLEHGPLGKDGIAARTRLTGVAVARRCTELERAGLIRDTGRKAKSTAGRDERVWEAVDKP